MFYYPSNVSSSKDIHRKSDIKPAETITKKENKKPETFNTSNIFDRERYDNSITSCFKSSGRNVALFIRKIHIFELSNVDNATVNQCNSYKSPGSSILPEIHGAVVVNQLYISNNNFCVFVELTGRWKFKNQSNIPPFVESTVCDRICYRKILTLYPESNEQTKDDDNNSNNNDLFNKHIQNKVNEQYGKSWKCYPFKFDMQHLPSSLQLLEPYGRNQNRNGFFWQVETYLAKADSYRSLQYDEAQISIYKFLIAQDNLAYELKENCPSNYTRFSPPDSILNLSGRLDKTAYFHGDEIHLEFSLNIASSIITVESFVIYLEQHQTHYLEMPREINIPLSEVVIKLDDPITGTYSNSIVIKPDVDWSKLNLALDAKMSRDDKVYIASSSLNFKPDKTQSSSELIHPICISYQIVVRCNLLSQSDKIAGHPYIKLPLILSRASPFINEIVPATWVHPSVICDSEHTSSSNINALVNKTYSQQSNKAPNTSAQISSTTNSSRVSSYIYEASDTTDFITDFKSTNNQAFIHPKKHNDQINLPPIPANNKSKNSWCNSSNKHLFTSNQFTSSNSWIRKLSSTAPLSNKFQSKSSYLKYSDANSVKLNLPKLKLLPKIKLSK